MIQDILKKAGFSEKEADVYVALFELGPSVVSAIAKRAGINRSTTYVVLDMLSKRGVLSLSERRGIKTYSAVAPEKVVADLEKKARQFTELASEAKKLLPRLKAKQKETVARANVRILEGEEGLKTAYEDALSSLETVRTYAFNRVEDPDASHAVQKYYNDLKKKNVNVKVLFPQGGKEKALPQNFSPEISVYGNKIVFASPEEKFALIIENRELADALKKAFDLSYKEGKGMVPGLSGATA